MIKTLALISFLFISNFSHSQDFMCEGYQNEINFWKQEYNLVANELDAVNEALAKLEEGEPEVITIEPIIRTDYPDLEIGYFYYNYSGDLRYRQLR